jgi:hypothetical protein
MVYLQITYELLLKRIWPKGASADKYFELCDFSRENTNIETYRCECELIDTENISLLSQNMKFVCRAG